MGWASISDTTRFGSKWELVSGFLTVDTASHNNFFTSFKRWIVYMAGFHKESLHTRYPCCRVPTWMISSTGSFVTFSDRWITTFNLRWRWSMYGWFLCFLSRQPEQLLFAEVSVSSSTILVVWQFDVFFFSVTEPLTPPNWIILGTHVFGNVMLECRNWISYFYFLVL